MRLCALRTDGPGRTRLCPGTIPEGAELIAWPKGQSLACRVPGHQLEWRGLSQLRNLVSRAKSGPDPPAAPGTRRDTETQRWRESPGARKAPRKRAAHAVGGPQPSPRPRLCVQIPRPTPVSRASPLHCRTACSLGRKRCDCSFTSPQSARSPGAPPALCSLAGACGPCKPCSRPRRFRSRRRAPVPG